MPDTLAVGSELTFTNHSDEELHELVLARLPDDEDRPVSEFVELPSDELGQLLGGGPEGVAVAPPGEEGEGSPDAEGGPPHVAHGMFAEFPVEE